LCPGQNSDPLIPYHLEATRINNPNKTEVLNLDKTVSVRLKGMKALTVADIAAGIFVDWWYPGLYEIRGKCRIVNDTILNVGGRDIHIDDIWMIRAASPAGIGSRVTGIILLATVPVWTYLAVTSLSQAGGGAESVFTVLFITAPSIALGVGCLVSGLLRLFSKDMKRTYRLGHKWDLRVVEDEIPLRINPE
jgi:hypothetical protein